eukprot:295254-Pelagomonas_calceolata.AAC.1
MAVSSQVGKLAEHVMPAVCARTLPQSSTLLTVLTVLNAPQKCRACRAHLQCVHAAKRAEPAACASGSPERSPVTPSTLFTVLISSRPNTCSFCNLATAVAAAYNHLSAASEQQSGV